MNLKYVGGYLTRDGKFHVDRELAELHDAKLEFIEMYDKSGHGLMCTDDTDTMICTVPPENIHAWITSMPDHVLQQFKAMVKDINYTPMEKDDDE